jgi:hypothetical protein
VLNFVKDLSSLPKHLTPLVSLGLLPAPCLAAGCVGEMGRENLRVIERGKGGRDKPRRLPAAVLPSTVRELRVQGSYRCTDNVVNCQTMSLVPTL